MFRPCVPWLEYSFWMPWPCWDGQCQGDLKPPHTGASPTRLISCIILTYSDASVLVDCYSASPQYILETQEGSPHRDDS